MNIKRTRRRRNKMTNLGFMAAVAAVLSLVVTMSFSSFAAEDRYASDTDLYQISSDSNRTIKVYVNGEEPYQEDNFLINDTTYVPIRAFANAMGKCEISWSDEGHADISADSLEIIAYQGSNILIANERYIFSPSEIMNIDSRIYVPVRSMAKAYSLSVNWNADDYSVDLGGIPTPLESADEYYNETDIYWLSRIINAESAGEPLLGKIAVGNVVINRSKSEMYPDTIYGVIFDRKYGTQFSPVDNGMIYNVPGEESVVAAKICLEGYSLSDEILFFINPRIATNNWVSVSRKYAFTIGNHDFYI